MRMNQKEGIQRIRRGGKGKREVAWGRGGIMSMYSMLNKGLQCATQ